jgi:L-lactate dehydrogenase
VRRAAYNIIAGKGATYYGIGSALARIVDVIIGDQRSILTVCTPAGEILGVRDVTISLPRLVGGEGILGTFSQPMSPEETSALHSSAEFVASVIRSVAAE